MISVSELRIKLEGYPEVVLDYYEEFCSTKDPEYLTRFIVGLILFLKDASSDSIGEELSDDTDMVLNLGIDSITIAEVVFLLEDVFEIEIENKDLLDITTIGKMRQYVLEKLDR